MKKIFLNNKNPVAIVSIMIALVVLIVATIVSLLPKTVPVPKNTVTVTIDEPGAVLSLNPANYSVLSANTVASEDRHFIYNLSGSLPFKQSSSLLIKALVDANVMQGVSYEAILLAVESGSVEDFEEVCTYFKSALAENNCTAKLYTLHINKKLTNISDIAEKHNTTYAKAMLCNKLSKELDMNVEDLISKTITEILNISKNTAGDDEVIDNITDNINSDAAKDDKENISSSDGASSNETSGNDASSDDSSSSGSSDSSSSNDSSSNDASSNDSSSSGSSDSSSNNSSSGISFTQEPNDDGWYPHM